MPHLTVKLSLPAGSTLAPDELSPRIASGLTDTTAQVLGKRPELTAVAIEWLEPSAWFIGGAPRSTPGARAAFFVEIKITANTNTKDDRARYLERVFALMDAVLGGASPESYVVIHDVAADSWGYGGKTQEARFIAGRPL
jgi:4-oxalocrotonate tautomerase